MCVLGSNKSKNQVRFLHFIETRSWSKKHCICLIKVSNTHSRRGLLSKKDKHMTYLDKVIPQISLMFTTKSTEKPTLKF